MGKRNMPSAAEHRAHWLGTHRLRGAGAGYCAGACLVRAIMSLLLIMVVT